MGSNGGGCYIQLHVILMLALHSTMYHPGEVTDHDRVLWRACLRTMEYNIIYVYIYIYIYRIL